MSLLLLGLNHRTAPVEVRERLAFSRQGVATALMLFARQFPGCEAAILSTCNRVEIIFGDGSEEGSPTAETERRLIDFLAQVRNVPAGAFEPHLYRAAGTDAVRQVFRVVSGLDSMVLGECQIVNQFRQAYELAHEQQTAGPVLHRLFHHAFGVGKRVRSEGHIGDGKTSVPSLATDVIRDGVENFRHARILIVGAGEMARLSLEHLSEAGARNFVVTTRTVTNARALADAYQARVAPFEALDAELSVADVVITATNCPMPIVTVERLRKTRGPFVEACLSPSPGVPGEGGGEGGPSVRDPQLGIQKTRTLTPSLSRSTGRGGGGAPATASRPLLLVDLCVPRNVDPAVAGVPGVTLYDVDALGRSAQETMTGRRRQIRACEQIVEEEVAAFDQWLAESKVRPLIEQMFEDVRALAAIEVRGFFRRCPDLTDAQREAVGQLADRIVGKLMHPCVATVRRGGSFDSAAALADAFHDTRLSFAARVEASAQNAVQNAAQNAAQVETARPSDADVGPRPKRGGCPVAAA